MKIPNLHLLVQHSTQIMQYGLLLGTTQYWADLANHRHSWDRRTILMSDYIPKGVKSLLEFGCGRCVVKNYLPEGCEYIPSDIVYRPDGEKETLICDLNKRPLPVLKPVDLMMFAGVLEYIKDVPAVIRHLSQFTQGFIVSYCCSDYYTPEIVKTCGWYSITNREFVKVFYDMGFEIVKIDKWENQRIYLFLRKNSDFLPA